MALIYTANPASIPRFLKHIASAGVPEKLTLKYLESVGFKTKNDRVLISILRALGFIDASQAPTERWKQYRDKSKSRQVLGAAVQGAYGDLFKTYPDAHARDADTIRNFLSSKSNVADSTLKLAVATFKALAAESAFNGAPVPLDNEEAGADDDEGGGERHPRQKTGLPSLSVAVQVYIDKDMSAEQVEHVFASMAKHLYGKD